MSTVVGVPADKRARALPRGMLGSSRSEWRGLAVRVQPDSVEMSSLRYAPRRTMEN